MNPWEEDWSSIALDAPEAQDTTMPWEEDWSALSLMNTEEEEKLKKIKEQPVTYQPPAGIESALATAEAPINSEDKFSRTVLSKDEETKFQQWIHSTPWYSEYVQRYGEEPDFNTPDYDYRGAWKSGVKPERSEIDGQYHWGSVRPDTGEYLKSANHPTFWKQKFIEKNGYDPDKSPITLETKPKPEKKFYRKDEAGEY